MILDKNLYDRVEAILKTIHIGLAPFSFHKNFVIFIDEASAQSLSKLIILFESFGHTEATSKKVHLDHTKREMSERTCQHLVEQNPQS